MGSRRGKRHGLETLRQKDYRKKSSGETLSRVTEGVSPPQAGNLSGKRTEG